MNHSRFGLLGLCALVLGLMTFSVASARAEVGAQWLFAEQAPNSGLVPFLEASVAFEIDQKIVLHTEILKIKVLLLCPTIQLENAVLKANGSIGEGARIKLSGCTFDLNGVTNASCEPKNEGTEAGVIKTKTVHALIILHKLASGVVDDFLLVLPDSGETLVTFETAASCPIGSKIPLIGKFTIKDCENLALTHLVKHLVEVGTKAELSELWMVSKTTEHETSILGGAWAFLTGPHEGLKVSGDPA
jgi:hypothetical protein